MPKIVLPDIRQILNGAILYLIYTFKTFSVYIITDAVTELDHASLNYLMVMSNDRRQGKGKVIPLQAQCGQEGG